MYKNNQQNFNTRNMFVHINDYSKLEIGKNLMTNRLNILNNKIEYDRLNSSLETYVCMYVCIYYDLVSMVTFYNEKNDIIVMSKQNTLTGV